jgi:hypothetical protein
MLFGSVLPNFSNIVNLFVSYGHLSFRIRRLCWGIYLSRMFGSRFQGIRHSDMYDVASIVSLSIPCLVYGYSIEGA